MQFSVICCFFVAWKWKAISRLSLNLKKEHCGHLCRDIKKNVLMLKNFFLHDLYFPCIKCHRYFPFSYLVLFTHVLCWQCVWQLNMEPHSLSSIPFDVTDMLTRVQTRIRSNTFKEPCNTQCNISEANDPHMLQQQQQFFNNITLLCVLVIFFHPLFWAGSGWRELAKSCLVGFSRARNCSWNTSQKRTKAVFLILGNIWWIRFQTETILAVVAPALQLLSVFT